MKTDNIRGALFDLDGVIIDSEGTYSLFWSARAKEYAVPVPNFAQVIKGTTLDSILNYFPASEHATIIDKIKDYERHMLYPVFPGVIEFLTSLRREGFRTAIVTSSGEAKMERLWEQQPGLRAYFDSIITDADVQRSKPDPQGYLIAAERIGCSPERCYVFEDSFNGLLAGRRAGACVIGLATTNPAESLQGKADLIIDSFVSFSPSGLPSLPNIAEK